MPGPLVTSKMTLEDAQLCQEDPRTPSGPSAVDSYEDLVDKRLEHEEYDPYYWYGEDPYYLDGLVDYDSDTHSESGSSIHEPILKKAKPTIEPPQGEMCQSATQEVAPDVRPALRAADRLPSGKLSFPFGRSKNKHYVFVPREGHGRHLSRLLNGIRNQTVSQRHDCEVIIPRHCHWYGARLFAVPLHRSGIRLVRRIRQLEQDLIRTTKWFRRVGSVPSELRKAVKEALYCWHPMTGLLSDPRRWMSLPERCHLRWLAPELMRLIAS